MLKPTMPSAGPSGRVFTGGSQNFNEASGQYRQKPPVVKPNVPTAPLTKPQARMQALQKRFQ